jgi:hypothetical protein
MSGHTLEPRAFDPAYLADVRHHVRKSPYLRANNLNRDFVGTRGFSVVFHRTALARVIEALPWSEPFLQKALRPDCNAFYFNPLELTQGSHVAPHIDRSLRSYVLDIDPPLAVAVLYVDVPRPLRGGDLLLRRGKKFLGRITPEEGLLVTFDGDLEHAVERVDVPGKRLSLVCEQYELRDDELADVPEFVIESQQARY